MGRVSEWIEVNTCSGRVPVIPKLEDWMASNAISRADQGLGLSKGTAITRAATLSMGLRNSLTTGNGLVKLIKLGKSI